MIIIGPQKKDYSSVVFLVIAVLDIIIFVTGNFVSSIKALIPAFIELLYRYLVWVGPGLVAVASLITILSRETGADKLLCVICALLSIDACMLLAVLLRIRLRAEQDLIAAFLFVSFWLLHLIYSGIMKAVVNRTGSAGVSGLNGVRFLSFFVMIWFFLAVSITLTASYLMLNVDNTSCFHGVGAIFISGVIILACFLGCIFSGRPMLKPD